MALLCLTNNMRMYNYKLDNFDWICSTVYSPVEFGSSGGSQWSNDSKKPRQARNECGTYNSFHQISSKGITTVAVVAAVVDLVVALAAVYLAKVLSSDKSLTVSSLVHDSFTHILRSLLLHGYQHIFNQAKKPNLLLSQYMWIYFQKYPEVDHLYIYTIRILLKPK